MENKDTPETSIFSLGKEFAFEGMDPNSFIGHTALEYREFKKGYEEGIRILKERQLISDDVVENIDEGVRKKM